MQWEILDLAFRRSTLVLIGDPKQAIYSFRGADVYAYLAAAEVCDPACDVEHELAERPGADRRLRRALLGGPAWSRGHRLLPRSRRSSGRRRRYLRRPELYAPASEDPRSTQGRVDQERVCQVPGVSAIHSARPCLRRHVSAHLLSVDLRRSRGVRPIAGVDRSRRCRSSRAHQPAGERVRDALHESGVPAVVAGGGSVFESTPATEWVRLLTAIDKPTSRRLAATAALTHFVGWSADHVASADDEDWEDLHWRLARWSAVLRGRGVAALLEHVSSAGLPSRVLSLPSGERVSDRSPPHRQAPAFGRCRSEPGTCSRSIAWLRRRIAEAGEDRNDEDRSLRLESDAEAVQVLTIHRSKGLEFPIVYCPYLWDGWERKVQVPVFHDPDDEDALTVDVGGESVGFTRRQQLHIQEQRGESLRLLYVALTRARHQAVVWWAGSYNSGDSPLGRLLFYRDADGVVSSKGGRTPTDEQAWGRLEELARSAAGCIGVESADGHEGATLERSVESSPDLEAAVFDRSFDERWRRTSYSGITAEAHDPRVGSEPDEHLVTDEPSPPAEPVAAERHVTSITQIESADRNYLQSTSLALSAMPGGVEVGSFVHGVLEETDFAAADLDEELRVAIEATSAHRPVALGDRDLLVAGLRTAIDTPLGELVDEMSLRQIRRPDRLDEVTFELPLAGGETPHGSISMVDVAHVFRRHVTEDDQLATYADRLEDPMLARSVRGYLTGSIDLVFRFSGHRLAIVDYKTNRLAPQAEELNAWHYRPEALSREMQRAHYPLQAILYTVALHRYMRWRDPGYEAGDIAGVLYLFLRGMSSPTFPTADGQPCGVWSWRPPTAMVEELSDLFDMGSQK